MVIEKRSDNEEDECPTNDFEKGESNGKCWSDGHYKCTECKNYREDFKRLGQEYIDFCHQPRIYITTLDVI